MNDKTYEALKKVVQGAKFFIDRKYGDRKRLTQDEVWEKATMTRDIVQVKSWIDKTAKEHEYTCEGCGAFPQGFDGFCDSCLGKNKN